MTLPFKIIVTLDVSLQQQNVARPDNREITMIRGFWATTYPRRGECFAFGVSDVEVEAVRWVMDEMAGDSTNVVRVDLAPFETKYYGSYNSIVAHALQAGFKAAAGTVAPLPSGYFAHVGQWLRTAPRQMQEWFASFFGLDMYHELIAPLEGAKH